MESNILHETGNLYLYRNGSALEIRLTGATHSVVVGNPSMGADRAKLTMERLERGIVNLRKMYNHY